MADTVDLPGIGKVKREYVYAGGALVLGIVAYAWWQAGRSGGPVEDAGPMVEAPITDRVPVATGDATVTEDLTGDTITTNAQWSKAAIDYLSQIGYDPVAVSTALGKYLARERLRASGTPSELDMVRSAVGAFGPPPEGGPYAIQPELPDTAGPSEPPPSTSLALPPKVVGLQLLKATSNSLRFRWSPVPSQFKVQRYHIRETSAKGSSTNETNAGVTEFTLLGLQPDLDHVVRVSARNATGEGPPAQLTFRTARK